MERAVIQVKVGVEKSQAVTHSIERIEQSTLAVEQALGTIATATAEQSSASQDIARNIEHIHSMTQSSDVSVHETQVQTQQLRQLADDLRRLMDRFRV